MTLLQAVVDLPADLEDEIGAWLWTTGSLGQVVEGESPFADVEDDGRRRMIAYFPEEPTSALADRLRVGLASWGDRVQLVDVSVVEDRDWLAEYRRHAMPFDLGRGFRVDPGDEHRVSSGDAGAERRWLHIPARQAFGTGSHETTRLVAGWLEDLEPADSLTDARVLDVGTGTGILAIIAHCLGASVVIGFDIDPVALPAARINRDINTPDAPIHYYAGTIEALAPEPTFDLALVNVLPGRIRHHLKAIVDRVRIGGRLIASGNLIDEHEQVAGWWRDAGCVVLDHRTDGEWLALLLERRSSELSR
ncbi:MAG: 50S ribosomal protein L11 methyltransferase [Acidobacteriota bacterium]